MKKVIYMCIFLFSGTVGNTQNAASDFKKMNKFYLDHQHVSMDVEYRFFENHQATKEIDFKRAKYRKSGVNYYYDMDGVTTIQNKKYKLAVHENNEVILVGKKTAEFDPVIYTGSIMDSAIKVCQKVDFKELPGGVKRYSLYYRESNYFPYSKVVVELNKDNSLAKMVYYYNRAINYTPEENDVEEPPRLEIVYNNTSTQTISSSQYSLSKYVKINGEKVITNSRYANYRLINQLTQTL